MRAVPRHRPGRQGQRLRLRRSDGSPRSPSSPAHRRRSRHRTLAVGTYAEVPLVEAASPATVLVLTPWRPFETAGDLRPAGGPHRRPARGPRRPSPPPGHRTAGPRVVLELLTSMRRHGFTPRGLRDGGRRTSTVCVVEGFALHLPMVTRLAPRRGRAAADRHGGQRHPDPPGLRLAPDPTPSWPRSARPGPTSSCGRGSAPSCGSATAARSRSGRRSSTCTRSSAATSSATAAGPRPSTGTSSSSPAGPPTGSASRRRPAARRSATARPGSPRAASTPPGSSARRSRSSGKQRLFAEPPHMQASMLFLPHGAAVPAVGDRGRRPGPLHRDGLRPHRHLLAPSGEVLSQAPSRRHASTS